MTKDTAGARDLRLHLYSHCPFCVRVQLVLGWAKISYEQQVWGYGDMTLAEKFGKKKMLPYLEYTDDDGSRKGMYESGEIIQWLAKTYGIEVKASRDIFSDWMRSAQEAQRILGRPRKIKMPDFDWSKAEDIKYAKNKYEKQGFDYDEAMSKSDEYSDIANKCFEELESKLLSWPLAADLGTDDASWPSGAIAMDDVLLVADLRGFTVVKSLSWPSTVLRYVTRGCGDAGVSLYFEHAL